MAYVERSGTGIGLGVDGRREDRHSSSCAAECARRGKGGVRGVRTFRSQTGVRRGELLVGTLYLSLGLIDDAIRGACMFKLH